MKDEEVGKLWRLYVIDQADKFTVSIPDYGIAGLIRKLVEERALRTKTHERCKGWCAINEALRDFGIPSETWPREHEQAKEEA